MVSLKWKNPTVTVSGLKQSCFQADLYSHWRAHRGRGLVHGPFSPPPSFPRSYSVSALYFSVPCPPSPLPLSSLWLGDEAASQLPPSPQLPEESTSHATESQLHNHRLHKSVIVRCGPGVECCGFKEEITSSSENWIILSVWRLWTL